MRFLVDADLPRPTVDLLRRLGHHAVDVRDIGLGAAEDGRIAEHARTNGLCLVTGDFDFADIRSYPPHEYAGIVVLALPKNANRDAILGLVEKFLKQSEVLERLTGRLAIVAPGSVRLRPA